MKHPFINNRKLSFYYVIFWLVIAIGNTFLQLFWYDLDFEACLLESFSVFVLYPILGASIWYLVIYNGFTENNWSKPIFFHLVAASIINAIWLYLCIILAKTINESHLSYVYETIPSKILSGYMLYVGYVVFFYAINYYYTLKEKVKREAELKTLVRDAELSALKSQINPHFLFNSLNSISSLTISNPEKAQEMVINLSSVMRYSLQHNQKEIVSFSEEIENIRLYLGIEKIRFGKKLEPVFNIDENCLQAKIPNMILQPLFENAIKYGVYEATQPVRINVDCRMENGYLFLSVENEYDSDSMRHKGEGIGLKNIRQRLELIYSNPSLIRVTDNKTTFKVELMIPQK